MSRRWKNSSRKSERGVTLLITAVAIIPLLGMAALAIDVVSLYAASGQAQTAADAGALAGAKAFVSSGFTSWQLGDPTSGANQAFVCNGSSGFSDLQAQAAAQQNLIAGTAPTTVATSCNFSSPNNPSITVTVTRTGLPTFFARIWGASASTARATATAEAYNPSGSTTVPIQVHSVKPWLIANCNPAIAPPCNGSPFFFIDSSNNYSLPSTNQGVGSFYLFTQTKAKVSFGYYAVDLPQGTVSCPSSSAAPVGSCSNVNSDTYQENIACSNSQQLSCGATVKVFPNTGTVARKDDTTQGTQCLVHTTGNGNPISPPSCNIDDDPDCFSNTSPISINGGSSNQNPALRGATNISNSDSVVTVPVFDYQNPGDDPCTPACGKSVTVIGFLQLGIQSISRGGGGNKGKIGAVVLNAVGCDPSSAGNPTVSADGLSPIPARLIR